MERSSADGTPILLVTANVGSLFEDPTRLLQPWLQEMLRMVEDVQPHFFALHLQEVGGKTYEKSMECVQEFIKCLCEASVMSNYNCIRIYMDEDYKSAEHFTALGNLYFAHNKLNSLRIWNFLTHSWELAEDKSIYSGNIETIATKEKSKFPQHFFPECKWSRKGFMRTRWEINKTVIDLVNIHLFHDASNLAACEEFPSVYCKTRRRALVHTLERFHLDEKNGLAPYFVFGDFNFRCDTGGVINELTSNLTAHRVQSLKNDSTKVHYRNALGDNVLTVGKKEFNHADHQLKFKEAWLKKFDRELEALNEILFEFPIDFAPSYPYEEDPEMPTDYMSTRCPSWCDRILMSPQTKEIIVENLPSSTHSEETNNPYHIIGENICMGDHKPIYLNICLKPNQGTYKCCKCFTNSALKYNNNYSKCSNNAVESFLELKATPPVPKEHLPSKTFSAADDADKDTITIKTTTTLSAAQLDFICPYKSKVYHEILLEGTKLHKTSNCNKSPASSQQLQFTNSPHQQATATAQEPNANTVPSVASTSKDVGISINLIDSDNMYVCMCSQISNNDSTAAVTIDCMDGSICPECRNIIKRQPQAHRYRLISKRLVLKDNIIVNHIDTQYLSTGADLASRQRCDPYTPESAESHSPCPELNSHSTSSSDGHSPFESLMNTTVVPREAKSSLINRKRDSNDSKNCTELQSLVPHNSKSDEETKLQQRGVVSPVQLKSRLEDLQRSSKLGFPEVKASTNESMDYAAVKYDNVVAGDQRVITATSEVRQRERSRKNDNDDNNDDDDNDENVAKKNRCDLLCCSID